MTFISNLKRSLLSRYNRAFSYKTSRKIVVLESDDWGTIRMSSKNSIKKLLAKGYPVDRCPYNKYDSLETNEDVSKLANVLAKHRDKNGSPAKITLNTIVANPNFDKIKASNYKEYFYEDIRTTYRTYPDSDFVIDLFNKGIEEGVFSVQYHGREHLNVQRWLKELQKGNRAVLDAFDERVFSPKVHSATMNYPLEFMDALNASNETDEAHKVQSFIEGLNLFEEIFNKQSESVIAPCYVWPKSLELALFEKGVKYIQGNAIQKHPIYTDDNATRNVYHYMGQKNAQGQLFLTRNAFFEPSIHPNIDSKAVVLNQINGCFNTNVPCIISSHRINYMSRLDVSNRDQNLMLLDDLLGEVVKNHPDVEFMSSEELGQLISKKP